VLSTIKSECQQGQWQFHGLSLSNDSNIRPLPLKTLLVQLEILGVIKPLFSFFADIKYKFLNDKNKVLESFQDERRQFLTAIFTQTRFKKIWGELDFDSLNQAYPCQRSRVISALDYLQDNGHIVLETKKMTEVYQVNTLALLDSQLAAKCQAYFEEKQQSEIKRIEALISFFVSTQCLSNRLSAYFDEVNPPHKCGHCSVCRGHFAQLKYSVDRVLPSDSDLIGYLIELIEHMQSRGKNSLSDSTLTRFLTGLIVPMFTRENVKSLAGFASCEGLRYEIVHQKVAQFRTKSLLK
jgi:ATP-dependent DNA helicase RecQ